MIPIIVLIGLLVFFNEQAYSFYLDPGTSSYLTQIIVAAAFSGIFYLKNIKNYIKNVLHRSKNKDANRVF
jgi:hypothetical protein